MIRRFALVTSLLLGLAASVAAQMHPSSHSQGRSHDASGHESIDPVLHALLHGDWHGTLSVSEGLTSALDLNVSTNELGKEVFRVTAEPAAHVGPASELAIEGHSVRWVQDVSGTPCKAAAHLVPATTSDSDTLKGTMSCAQGDMTFALRKTKQ